MYAVNAAGSLKPGRMGTHIILMTLEKSATPTTPTMSDLINALATIGPMSAYHVDKS